MFLLFFSELPVSYFDHELHKQTSNCIFLVSIDLFVLLTCTCKTKRDLVTYLSIRFAGVLIEIRTLVWKTMRETSSNTTLEGYVCDRL